MIKVLQKGVVPVFKIKCSQCNSILEFNENDEYVVRDDGLRFKDNKLVFSLIPDCVIFNIECPMCHSQIMTREFTNGEYFDYRSSK